MLKLIFNTLLLLGITVPFASQAMSLPERIDYFIELFDYQEASASFDMREISRDYPAVLLTPESLLPQTANYPLKDLQQLYHLAQTCLGKLPYNPLVTEPLVFTRALCNQQTLPLRWFAQSGLIHPGGGSYAVRYLEQHPEMQTELTPFMHIQERTAAPKNSLLGRLQAMDESAIRALLAGSSLFLDGDELWLRQGPEYFLFPWEIWKKNRQQAGLSYQMYQNNQLCFMQRGNLCWEIEDEPDFTWHVVLALVGINILLIINWLIYRWNSKRKELHSRMLVLQILTHELRTPIASLSLTVEGFRREFEHLPESVYDEFRRLCEDTRRLRQLAEASKDYLQSDNKPLVCDWVNSVEEWLSYQIESFAQPIELIVTQDCAVKINVYWLGNCVDNLLRNAIKYGVAPIQLVATTSHHHLQIKVIDQGQLTHKNWRHLRQPFVSKSGLGLGLTIVESMAGRMGGKMTLIGPPTTFILEIPCETDIASG